MRVSLLMFWALLQAGQPGGTPREAALWQEIQRLQAARPASQPFGDCFARVAELHGQCVAACETYLTLFPGGEHAEAVIRTELAARFELALVTGGDLTPLCERARAIGLRPATPTIAAEVGYWLALCEHRAQTRSASQPVSIDVSAAQWQELQSEYVRRHPTGPDVPRFVALAFDEAATRGDVPQMRRLYESLRTTFPEHAVTESLAGHLHRVEAVDQPFTVALALGDGRVVDTAGWRGRPGVLVVWASFEPACAALLAEVERLRRAEGVAVAGVNLDAERAEFEAGAKAAGIDWPQVFDGLGWGGTFARQWGIRRIPLVFAIDAQGVLRGTGGEESWRGLLAKVALGSPAATSAPAN